TLCCLLCDRAFIHFCTYYYFSFLIDMDTPGFYTLSLHDALPIFSVCLNKDAYDMIFISTIRKRCVRDMIEVSKALGSGFVLTRLLEVFFRESDRIGLSLLFGTDEMKGN